MVNLSKGGGGGGPSRSSGGSSGKTTMKVEGADKLEPDFDAFFDEVAKEMLARIKRRTPVKTGATQNGWAIVRNGAKIQFTNDQPAANFLEHGTSNMEPVGMVRTTVAEMPQIIAEKKGSLKLK